MRILFIICSLGSGGMERRLTELLKRLRLISDIEFELVLMSYEVHYKEIFDLGVKIHFVERNSRKDMFMFGNLFRLFRDYAPDIVHCWDSMTAVYSAPLCRLLRIKLVNGMVTNSPRKYKILNKNWIRAKLTFPFSDYIVGNSAAGLKAYGSPDGKSRVIYNGFDFARIAKIIPEEIMRDQLKITTRYVIGMVATFSAKKDYPTYFMAARKLLEEGNDVTFLAIGTGTDSPGSVNYIDDQYSRNFRLLGNRSEIESYINIMDICVLSTYTEGISNSVIEYMAMAKPVVATDGGGTNELVDEGKTGFLIGPSDHNALASRLQSLLNDPELRKQMGTAGVQRIREEFSIERMVSNYLELYKSLCN
ncbi:MAG TPA: hypothetical protein DDW27_12850 [Bacteroidales bacterium]|nr:hypothetical protein [Bacteroidales bacterium]